MKFRLSIPTVLSSAVTATRAAARARAEKNGNDGDNKVPFRDPFVPRKLTPVDDSTNNGADDPWDFEVDDDEGGLWLLPEEFATEEPSAAPLKNVAGENIFASSGTSISTNNAKFQFEASEELGILDFDNVFVSNSNVEFASNLEPCPPWEDKPNIGAGADFQQVVRNCVENGSCRGTRIGCWRVDSVTDMSKAFYNLESFNEPLNEWNLQSVTTTEKMFYGAKNFNQQLPWNPLNVKNMAGMFMKAEKFNQQLNWTPQNLEDMSRMFYGAKAFNQDMNQWANSIATVKSMKETFKNAENFNGNIGNWKTSAVTDMSGIFEGAKKFNQDIGNNGNTDEWDVSNVKSLARAFKGARKFNQGFYRWDTSEVTDLSEVFRNAEAFNGFLNYWSTSKVTTMYRAFSGAKNFNYFMNWDTSNVTDMRRIFEKASSFNWDISGWNTAKITSLYRSFYNASSFNINIENWLPAGSQVTDLTSVFSGALAFNQPINNWDTSNVQNMNRALSLTYKFNQPLGGWDVSSVTSMNRMFVGAFKFNQPLQNWTTSNVSNMSRMFAVTVNFNQDIGNWYTYSVTDMSRMFTRARLFNQNLGDWDTSKVKNMNHMFRQSYFNQGIQYWNTASVTGMKKMFHYATFFNQPMDWDTSSVRDMSYMFSNAARFNQRLHDWNTSSVTNMKYMFKDAKNFLQCLNTWSTRTLPTDTTEIFQGSKCPYPDNVGGVPDIWCQNDSECGANSCEDNPNPWEDDVGLRSCADGLAPDFDRQQDCRLYFLENCPSICKDGCGICDNRGGEFPLQNPPGIPSTCNIVLNRTNAEILNMCKQPIVAFKCPGICSKSCCIDVESPFKIDPDDTSSPTTTCEAVSLSPSAEQAIICEEREVFKNCPTICRPDLCQCIDSPNKFVMENGQETSCEEVAGRPIGKRDRLCTNRESVRSNCPIVCGEPTECGDKNFEGEFDLRDGKTTSCATVQAQRPKRRKQRCKNKKIKENCPEICDDL